MTNMSKKELLKEVKPGYLRSNKEEKGIVLDEFCKSTGYDRKYAIRILAAGYDHDRIERIGRKRRKKKYSALVMTVVIKIWELLEYPCGVRLKPSLLPIAKALERHGELQLSNEVRLQLFGIGSATLDRRLKKERETRHLNRNRGTTRHGSLLKSSIPIRITNWDTSETGFLEMDTVAHNGGDPGGEFIYSLDMVEISSGWSEQYAVMGKGEKGIVSAIDSLKNDCPFNFKGLDSDSGSEFINWHLVRYCKEHRLFFTRSRPDRKNDNAYVEQKNYTHIRQWLGYGRYDTMRQLKLINNLYRNELRLFNNFFRPVMKIESKQKVNNSVCKKKYDMAKTPYQRLLESKTLTSDKEEELNKLYLSLNPVKLKKTIEKKLRTIKQSI